MEFIRDLSLAIFVATDVLASNDAIPTPAGRAQATQIYLVFISVIIENQFMLTKPYYSKLVDDTSCQFLNFDIQCGIWHFAFQVEAALHTTNKFFMLPPEVKRKYARPSSESNHGWVCVGRER